MFDLQKKLGDAARVALEKEYGVSTDVHFDVSFDEQKGDFTSSVALQISKKVGKKPQEVGQVIVTALRSVPSVTEAQVAGPGFVNVAVESSALVQEIAAQGPLLTVPTPDRGEIGRAHV